MDGFASLVCDTDKQVARIQVISHDMKGNVICVGIEFTVYIHIIDRLYLICLLLHMFCHICTIMQNVWCFLTFRK